VAAPVKDGERVKNNAGLESASRSSSFAWSFMRLGSSDIPVDQPTIDLSGLWVSWVKFFAICFIARLRRDQIMQRCYFEEIQSPMPI
jgi:hypothetical protein